MRYNIWKILHNQGGHAKFLYNHGNGIAIFFDVIEEDQDGYYRMFLHGTRVASLQIKNNRIDTPPHPPAKESE